MLDRHYTGDCSQKNISIAKNRMRIAKNRVLMSTKEHLVVQDQLDTLLNNELSTKSSPGPSTSNILSKPVDELPTSPTNSVETLSGPSTSRTGLKPNDDTATSPTITKEPFGPLSDVHSDQDNGFQQKKVSRAPSPATTTCEQMESVYLSHTVFEEPDQIQDFFFRYPVSSWDDFMTYSMHRLNMDFYVSCRRSFVDFVNSLTRISRYASVDQRIREHASSLRTTREASFRSVFFQAESQFVSDTLERKRRSEHSEENEVSTQQIKLVEGQSPHWMELHGSLLDSDPVDDNYLFRSDDGPPSSVESGDLTADIPPPTMTDYLVGPGTFSSNVTRDLSGHLIVDDTNLTDVIMDRRRKAMLAGVDTENVNLANFIVTRELLLTICDSSNVDKAFPKSTPASLDDGDTALIAKIAGLAGNASFDDLQELVVLESSLLSPSIVKRALTNYFSEAALWSGIDWMRPGQGNNEDTFTDTVVKPLLSAAFGGLAGCAFRWSRDSLVSKTGQLDERLQQPDYQVSYKGFVLVLGEIKTPSSVSADIVEQDRMKLFNMGKKSVDKLFAAGYDHPVVLVHGRGLLIDVYSMNLAREALYFTDLLGTFRAPSTPYDFPLLLGLSPLVSARTLVEGVFRVLKTARTTNVPMHWVRGTFDVKGIAIPE
ncbi:hypothetical protein BGX29_006843 [Mortierella sp. GBA35]|nr:hypothetical protein BGX29_006843 [Mortierella sp. GBA35]